MDLRIHSILSRSRANGPGIRYVVWFQGCSLRCPGCFNPDTHDPAGGRIVPVDALADEIAGLAPEIEGVTISGGEPLEQMDGLLGLLRGIRGRTSLTVILFTGYTVEEISANPNAEELLGMLDVLIAGRYDQARHLGHGLRGSANQRVRFLTDRYVASDLEAVPETEVLISPDGEITISGVEPPRISH